MPICALRVAHMWPFSTDFALKRYQLGIFMLRIKTFMLRRLNGEVSKFT